MIWAAPLSLCDLNCSILPSTCLNQFKGGGKKLRQLMSMDLLHSTLARAWQSLLLRMLSHQMLKSKKLSLCWLASRS
jgi:hypothetical protein